MTRALPTASPHTVGDISDRTLAASARPAYQAYFMLHVGFAALPIVAGLDKFFHLLVNWDQYLAPLATQVLPVSGHTFMLAVGVVEIVAGVLVALRPRIGAYVVALWLWGIIVNVLLIPGFYDVALRDFGLSVGALALARLSREFNAKLWDSRPPRRLSQGRCAIVESEPKSSLHRRSWRPWCCCQSAPGFVRLSNSLDSVR